MALLLTIAILLGIFPISVFVFAGTALSDGSYTAVSTSTYKKDGQAYNATVTITVSNGIITKVAEGDTNGSIHPATSDNKKYFEKAMTGINEQLKGDKPQDVNVSDIDTVSKATYSSKLIIEAIGKILGGSGSQSSQQSSQPSGGGSTTGTKKYELVANPASGKNYILASGNSGTVCIIADTGDKEAQPIEVSVNNSVIETNFTYSFIYQTVSGGFVLRSNNTKKYLTGKDYELLSSYSVSDGGKVNGQFAFDGKKIYTYISDKNKNYYIYFKYDDKDDEYDLKFEDGSSKRSNVYFYQEVESTQESSQESSTIPDNPVYSKVTWKNYDGTVLYDEKDQIQGYNYIYSGSHPQKESTVQYGYEFVGWSTKQNDSPDNAKPDSELGLVPANDNTVFYAVFRQVDLPAHNKKVVSTDTDNEYNLTLDVQSTPKTISPVDPSNYKGKFDIVVVVDRSASMKDNCGEGKSIMQKNREVVNSFANGLFEGENDNRMSIVSFGGQYGVQSGYGVMTGWLNNASAVQTTMNNLTYRNENGGESNLPNGTNYTAGLYGAAALLAGRRTAANVQTVVLFLSDGAPTAYYTSKPTKYSTGGADNGSVNKDSDAANDVAKAIAEISVIENAIDKFCAVAVFDSTDDSANTYLKQLANAFGDKGAFYPFAKAEEMDNTFSDIKKEIASSVTVNPKNLIITDTLSDYVELKNNSITTGTTVKKTLNGNTTTVSSSYYQLSYNNKTIKLDFNDDYELDEGAVYTLTVPIKATDKAINYYKQNGTYPNNGDTGTGTYAGKQGFYSNSNNATVYYEYDEQQDNQYTLKYAMPVIQVSATQEPTAYTVTWKSQDGNTILETDTGVTSGTKPSYDGAAPAKSSDATYDYTFAGWATSPNQESGTAAANLADVSDNVTYYAAFSKTQRTDVQPSTYTVTWKNYDGQTIASFADLAYGADTPRYSGTPTRASSNGITYTFAGWTPAVSEKVTGNAVYYATYNASAVADDSNIHLTKEAVSTGENTWQLVLTAYAKQSSMTTTREVPYDYSNKKSKKASTIYNIINGENGVTKQTIYYDTYGQLYATYNSNNQKYKIYYTYNGENTNIFGNAKDAAVSDEYLAKMYTINTMTVNTLDSSAVLKDFINTIAIQKINSIFHMS